MSWRPLLCCAALSVAAFLAMGAVAVAVLSYAPPDHHPPLCRKSSVLAVLPAAGAGRNKASMELLVWSGMGRNLTPLADLHSYDVGARKWRAVYPPGAGAGFWRWLRPKHPGPTPLPRWKAGSGQVVGSRAGMLVFGGDAFPPTWPTGGVLSCAVGVAHAYALVCTVVEGAGATGGMLCSAAIWFVALCPRHQAA